MDRFDELTDPQHEDYLSALYLTMLRLGQPTHSALVGTGLHPGDVTRAAAFLEGRGLITRRGEGAWDVVPPETALARRAAELESRARSVRNAANEMGALWRRASSSELTEQGLVGVEVLRSVDQVVVAASSLAATAEERLRIFLDDSPAARRLLLQDQPNSLTVVEATDVSLVVDIALFSREGVLDQVEALANAGKRIVVADGLPFSGLVVDDSAALIDLSRHDPGADGSFVVRRHGPTMAVAALFEIAFELATPLRPTLARAAGETEDPPLVPRDRRILNLLSAGASDQQIARQIGVSTRTVERRVAVLMQTLAVATRFQAGVQAARRGWI